MLGILAFSVFSASSLCLVRRSETDEDFIEEMFSEVGMEQDYDGFHVV